MRTITPLLSLCAAAAAVLSATPAAAERLDIDYRLYAPLNAAMESPTDQTLLYEQQASRVFDRILIAGTSATSDWREALEISVYARPRRLERLDQWMAAFSPASESTCPAAVHELTRDAMSITFALDAQPCASGPRLSGLYRVVLGRRSVYLIGAKLKGEMTAEQRTQWLTVLASAKLGN